MSVLQYRSEGLYSEEAAQDAKRYYSYLHELGIHINGQGLKYLLTKTLDGLPNKPTESSNLGHVIGVLHHCNSQEQEVCLSAIGALLADLSVDLSKTHSDIYSILQAHQKLELLMYELAIEEVDTFLQTDNDATRFMRIIIDFCTRSCHQLLKELSDDLREFNEKLARCIVNEQDLPDGVEAVNIVLKKIKLSRVKLPELLCRFLSLADNLLLNNFGVENVSCRYQKLAGIYLSQYWSTMLRQVCCDFMEPVFFDLYREKYTVKPLKGKITDAYNTLICGSLNTSESREQLVPHLKEICRRQYNLGRIVVDVRRDSLMSGSQVAQLERAVKLKLTLDFSQVPTTAPTSPLGQSLSARNASPGSAERKTSPLARIFLSPRPGSSQNRRWSGNFGRSQSERARSPRRNTVSPGRQSIFSRSRRPSEPVLPSKTDDETDIDNSL